MALEGERRFVDLPELGRRLGRRGRATGTLLGIDGPENRGRDVRVVEQRWWRRRRLALSEERDWSHARWGSPEGRRSRGAGKRRRGGVLPKGGEGCWGGTESANRSSLQAESGSTGGEGITSEEAGTRGGEERRRGEERIGSRRGKDWTSRGRSLAKHGGRGVVLGLIALSGGLWRGECRGLVHTTQGVLGPWLHDSTLSRILLGTCSFSRAGGRDERGSVIGHVDILDLLLDRGDDLARCPAALGSLSRQLGSLVIMRDYSQDGWSRHLSPAWPSWRTDL